MDKKRKALPSVGKIFDYWKDKHEITGFCFIDWGEPSCPSCGNPIHNIEFENKEKYLKYLKRGEFEKLWNTCVGLERHHIIPYSMGGGDNLDNLFLLCEQCHVLAPMTKNPVIFFNWLKVPKPHSRSEVNKRQAEELSKYIDTNFTQSEQKKIREVMSCLTCQDLHNLLKSKMSDIELHFDRSKGAHLSVSTLTGLIIDSILKNELIA